MSIRHVIAALALSIVGGCATWGTSYVEPVPSEVSQDWTLNSVAVSVPLSLTVSEANVFAPEADIVWQEDLLPPGTTRHAQVDEIMTEAVRRGASTLPGTRPVDVQVQVLTFHALSDYARVRLAYDGVHNIQFNMQVLDAATGEVLVPPSRIMADLPALSGQESIDALAIGQTQRVRISDHVAATVSGFLGTGPDNRDEFLRLGR